MIIGRTESADGGFRRIPVRHTRIIEESNRAEILSYLQNILLKASEKGEWIGLSELFPSLPACTLNTPLEAVYNLSSEKSKADPSSIKINLSKYLGMLVREAAYYSKIEYFEHIIGSVRKYSLASKKLIKYDPEEYRSRYINN